MVTCLQKSRAKLAGDESQAPCIQFNVSVDRLLGGDTHVYIYEGRRFCIPSNRHPRLQQVEQVRKHCKAQRLPCPGWKGYKNIFSSYEVENYLPLVVGKNRNEASAEMLRYRARSQTWNIHNLNKNAKFSYTLDSSLVPSPNFRKHG